MSHAARALLVTGSIMSLLAGQGLRIVDRSQPLAGAFDTDRGRLVSIGTHGETNEWDGVRWYQRPIDLLPMFQTSQRMVHDDTRGQVLLAGGGISTPFTTRAFDGTSCTATAPTLTVNEWPRPDTPTFELEIVDAPANSLIALLAATGAATIPLGSCTQLVQTGAATLVLPTSARGFATVGLPLPASVSFLGVDLYFQAAALDAAAPNGFTMTRGLQTTIGR